LQSNLNSKVIVPVCINGVDFPIGAIQICDLNSSHMIWTLLLKLFISADKVFALKVLQMIRSGVPLFENPLGWEK
jgi:hypothetical protein